MAGPDKQRSLFGEKSLNPILDLKLAMSRGIQESGRTREDVVDGMNAVVTVEKLRTRGKDGLVTRAMLDKWLAPEAQDQTIPVKLIPAFCRVTGSLLLLQALAGPVGGRVIGREQQILLEMAEAGMLEKKARRRKAMLEDQYREMGK